MKKKKLKLKKKACINLLIFIGLIIFGIYFYNIHYKSNDSKTTVKISNKEFQKQGYSNETIKLIKEKLTNEEIDSLKNKDKIDELELFIKEKYYLHKNLDLYISYYSAHKETSIKDVISIVNITLNQEGYENPKKADLSKENLVLVNKYNVLDKSYEPSNMINVDLSYSYEGRRILPEVNDAFIKMYNDAKKEEINLFVVSAYRSYSYQEKLYNNYITMYGIDYANTVSAKPGFSEHQTGLAMDILSPGVQMSEFENTKAYSWLKENSYKYGFILRYPKDKTYLTGYAFESWHYRYLGKEMAKKVYDENITYDEYYTFYLDNE